MKRLAIIAGLLALSLWASAQDDAQKAAADAAAAFAGAPAEATAPVKPNYWKYSTVFDIGVNQTSLVNWAAGGFGSVTLNTGFDAKLH